MITPIVFPIDKVINKICQDAKIVNHTNIWTFGDAEAIKNANSYCRQSNNGDMCLKIFIKIKQNTYKIICGK